MNDDFKALGICLTIMVGIAAVYTVFLR